MNSDFAAPVSGVRLYEGKAKVVYQAEAPDELLIVFKDTATAFDGKKRAVIPGKGVYNAQISGKLFEILEKNGIRTHYLGLLDQRTMRARKLTMFRFEVVVRNIVAGSLAKRIGQPEGSPLPFPVLETYYKSDELGDPILNDDHVVAFSLANRAELAEIKGLALKTNQILTSYLRERGILLVDFKLEFGREAGKEAGMILVGDEISPDTCRLWDAGTGTKLDKDRFRRDLGGLEEAYAEVLRRLS